jgi:hypothetical protein
MSIFSHPAQEDVDTSHALDLALILGALVQQVLGLAVENVSVVGVDVDLGEEVGVHEGVIGFRVVARQPDVLVLQRRWSIKRSRTPKRRGRAHHVDCWCQYRGENEMISCMFLSRLRERGPTGDHVLLNSEENRSAASGEGRIDYNSP